MVRPSRSRERLVRRRVQIRYARLPAGLHIRVTAGHGGRTIVYLLPGLSRGNRRAALARAVSAARLGLGPPLTPAALARAAAADRLRASVRLGVRPVRARPWLLVSLVLLAATAAMAIVMLLPAPGTPAAARKRHRPASVHPPRSPAASHRLGQPGDLHWHGKPTVLRSFSISSSPQKLPSR